MIAQPRLPSACWATTSLTALATLERSATPGSVLSGNDVVGHSIDKATEAEAE